MGAGVLWKDSLGDVYVHTTKWKISEDLEQACLSFGQPSLFQLCAAKLVSALGSQACFSFGQPSLFQLWAAKLVSTLGSQLVSTLGTQACFNFGHPSLFQLWAAKLVWAFVHWKGEPRGVYVHTTKKIIWWPWNDLSRYPRSNLSTKCNFLTDSQNSLFHNAVKFRLSELGSGLGNW